MGNIMTVFPFRQGVSYRLSVHLISTSFKLWKIGTKVCAGLFLRVSHQDHGRIATECHGSYACVAGGVEKQKWRELCSMPSPSSPASKSSLHVLVLSGMERGQKDTGEVLQRVPAFLSEKHEHSALKVRSQEN